MNDAPANKGKLGPFAWDDPLLLDGLLSEGERAIRDAAHATYDVHALILGRAQTGMSAFGG
jgi:hypothetical protein